MMVLLTLNIDICLLSHKTIWCSYYPCPGSWFNIKMTSYQYRESHCGFLILIRWHLFIESGPGSQMNYVSKRNPLVSSKVWPVIPHTSGCQLGTAHDRNNYIAGYEAIISPLLTDKSCGSFQSTIPVLKSKYSRILRGVIQYDMKLPSYQYRKFYCGDKMILSHLHNCIFKTSLYWIRAQYTLIYCVSRSSATIVLTLLDKFVLVCSERWFEIPEPFQCQEMIEYANILIFSSKQFSI